MRIVFETKFLEADLTMVSIGAMREDGKTYYAVSAELDRATEGVRPEVLARLGDQEPDPLERIAQEVAELFGPEPEIWADHSAHNWVVLCRLFGGVAHLPEGWPHVCQDVAQLAGALGAPQVPAQDPATRHNALEDAIASARQLTVLMGLMPSQPFYEPGWRAALARSLGEEVRERLGFIGRLETATVGLLPPGEALYVKPEGKRMAWVTPDGEVRVTSFGEELELPQVEAGYEATFDRAAMVEWSLGTLREPLLVDGAEKLDAQVLSAVEKVVGEADTATDLDAAERSIALVAGPGRLGMVELPSGVTAVVRQADLAVLVAGVMVQEAMSEDGNAWRWRVSLGSTVLASLAGVRRLVRVGPGAAIEPRAGLVLPGR